MKHLPSLIAHGVLLLSTVACLGLSGGPVTELSYVNNNTPSGSKASLDLACLSELEATYKATVAPVMSRHNCIQCHKASGAAASTRLLLDQTPAQIVAGINGMTTKEFSSFVAKPTLGVPHAGGKVFALESASGVALKAFVDLTLSKNKCLLSTQADCSGADVLERKFRRLSQLEYQNTLSAVFGSLVQPSHVASLEDEITKVGMSNNHNFLRFNEITLNQLIPKVEALSTAVASSSLADVAACRTSYTDACATALTSGYGEKLWRRPVSPAEVSAIKASIENVGSLDATEKIAFIVSSLLFSPNFWLKSEIGTEANGFAQLTDYEVASFLSYSLWNFPPDSTLYALAKNGTLKTPTVLRAQVQRLLASPRAATAMSNFVVDFLKVNKVFINAKNSTYTTYDAARAGLFESAYKQIHDQTSNPASKIIDLLSSNRFYVNDTLAPYFGRVPSYGAGLLPETISTSERVGILSHPAFLAVHANETSSGLIKRGVMTLSQLLCYDMPSAPAGASDPSPIPAGIDPAVTSERDIITLTHSSKSNCMGCHATIDPAGFGFENYDSVGRYRTVEKGTVPIDASGTLSGIKGINISFSNSPEYITKLIQSLTVRECVSERYFEHVFGVSAKAKGVACEMKKYVTLVNDTNQELRSMKENFMHLQSLVKRKPASAEVGD